MTHTTFKINNTSNNAYTFPTTNYSKILDNIIADNIKATNKYLYDYPTCGTIDDDFIGAMMKDSAKKHCNLFGTCLNSGDEFAKAANFLANYKSKKYTKLPFIFGKTYKLSNGTPIIFYDDEIQIGLDLYSYSDFSNIGFLKTLGEPTKKIIINIFNAGNSNIKINIL